MSSLDPNVETVTYNGRTMTFLAGNTGHMTGGEGVIMAEHLPIREGEVLFDVGASDSSWTLYALASGATVFAFEPSDRSYDQLVREVGLNEAEAFHRRAKLFNVGLDNRTHKGTLENWYESIGGPGFEVSPDCRVPVHFIEMDSFFPTLDRLDYVKVDVEGGELRVLEGGMGCLRKFRPRLILENHENIVRIGDWMRATGMLEKLHELLRELGYSWIDVPHQGRSFLIATPS